MALNVPNFSDTRPIPKFGLPIENICRATNKCGPGNTANNGCTLPSLCRHLHSSHPPFWKILPTPTAAFTFSICPLANVWRPDTVLLVSSRRSYRWASRTNFWYVVSPCTLQSPYHGYNHRYERCSLPCPLPRSGYGPFQRKSRPMDPCS
jgi:hypothetical protein